MAYKCFIFTNVSCIVKCSLNFYNHFSWIENIQVFLECEKYKKYLKFKIIVLFSVIPESTLSWPVYIMVLFPEILGKNEGKLSCSHLPLSGRDRKPTGKVMPCSGVFTGVCVIQPIALQTQCIISGRVYWWRKVNLDSWSGQTLERGLWRRQLFLLI